MSVLDVLAVLPFSFTPSSSPWLQPFPGCRGGTLEGCPSVANTTVHYITQKIDHFNWAAPLGDPEQRYFTQRYFTHREWWKPGGPILFYFGNEDDVELYVNHTGIMWEAARPLGAALVFAEHRYYGKSLPYAAGTPGCMSFLTTEQAMADFAYLLYALRDAWSAWDSAAIGFGGSYGGMIASWFRIKYPNAIDGVLAGSAPIWSFVGLAPPYDPDAFYRTVTRDASAAGGASDACKANVKLGLRRTLEIGAATAGRAQLASTLRMCEPPRDAADVWSVKEWLEGPWAAMAMGDYPYPSSYLMHGDAMLPAWPVRVACAPLAASPSFDPKNDTQLLEALRRAVAVYYNASGAAGPCNRILEHGGKGGRREAEAEGGRRVHASAPHARRKMTSPLSAPRPADAPRPAATTAGPSTCRGDWGYQWCTEMVQPFTAGTPQDMFYPFAPYNYTASAADCVKQWGVMPAEAWARIGLGGKRLEAASNMIFSNGAYDPWSGGGVLDAPNPSIHTLTIPSGAHHIDLMFSDPEDPADVGAARAAELEIIHGWVAGKALKKEL